MITQTSKYALRILVRLASAEPGEFVPGRALSDDTEVSADYLAKLLVALRNAGLVEATRGRGGGYRLVPTAAEVRLIDVVEVFEGIRSRPSCILGVHDVCSDERPCSAHASFRSIRQAYIDFLDTSSIADIRHPEASR